MTGTWNVVSNDFKPSTHGPVPILHQGPSFPWPSDLRLGSQMVTGSDRLRFRDSGSLSVTVGSTVPREMIPKEGQRQRSTAITPLSAVIFVWSLSGAALFYYACCRLVTRTALLTGGQFQVQPRHPAPHHHPLPTTTKALPISNKCTVNFPQPS